MTSIVKLILEGKETYEMYHGTEKEFDSFDLKFFNQGSGDGGWLGYGIYLTNDIEYAETYGDVLVCEVTVENPLVLKDELYSRRPEKLAQDLDVSNSRGVTKKLKEKGYDSVMLTYDENWGKFIEICVFDPSNIKVLRRIESEYE